MPDRQQMAVALAMPGLRDRVLLDLAAAAKALSRANGPAAPGGEQLAQGFLDDRAWLQLLVDRYGWARPHAPVLDPAAWRVLGELQRHGLEDLDFVFPGRIPLDVLLDQVFQRAGQRLAAANLPILLLEIERDATNLWDAFLELASRQDQQAAAWGAVTAAWFAGWPPLPALPDKGVRGRKPLPEYAALAMSKWARSSVEASPPDSRQLLNLRYSLLTAEPAKGKERQPPSAWTGDALHLVDLIGGLRDGHFFDFTRGLLALGSGMLERSATTPGESWLVHWLVTELPAISAHYAAGFAGVDPRLNKVFAATYGLLKRIDESAAAGLDMVAERALLADSVAQLALLVPDMAYYFDTPVRAQVARRVDACIGLVSGEDGRGGHGLTQGQFDACMEALLNLADTDARLAELSGDMNGPFTPETLERELSVAPWQRINYGIGFLHERFPDSCRLPARPLPNPLEWAVLATAMTWFAQHAPEFFDTPENEARLIGMRGIGEQLLLGPEEQAGCLSGGAAGSDDPIGRGMVDYELALRELEAGVQSAEADFREQKLSPGADISLDRDAGQKTAYRPEGLVIRPCDSATVCEMAGELSTTRALIGLFPDEYLVADQAGMGHIEICYQRMEWVQRRAELVRADDTNVANYYGRLAFDLVGRYVEGGNGSDIFAFRFTSPHEYHYLFAQASDEVLNDSCPVEWVGSRVVTPLKQRYIGLVPNRLTYLAASRNQPSRLLQNNWDQGAEWRDWFVTGIGVEDLEVPPGPDILPALNQHLQTLYQAEQDEIYRRLLLTGAVDAAGDEASLFDELSKVTVSKALLRMQMMLFYPDSMFRSDRIRTAVLGDAGLLDDRIVRRFREDDVALVSVNGIARERLARLRDSWFGQPPDVRRQGSVAASLMQAMTRINILYRQLFTSRPEALQETGLKGEPQGS